jgi:hypothetical protein
LKIPKRGNQNPYIEEEQTTQWPKGKVQKDTQQSTKHTHKTKGRVSSSTTKTGRHDIAEALLKMALNTINQINQNQIESFTVTTIIVLE